MSHIRIKQVLVLAVIAVLVTMSFLISPASAESIRVDFENYNIACTLVSQDPPRVTDGGIVHLRNRVYESVILSDSDYYAGTGGIVGNANLFDPAVGIGTYFGTLEIYPTIHPDGYWAGHWSMQITETGYKGIARLQGYGSMEGMSSFATLTPLPPNVLANFVYLCSGNQPASDTYAVGYTIMPDGE